MFASQSATPSSTGGVQNALSFGVSASKALNRNAHAAVSVSYDTYTDAANATRQAFTIAPTYTYALNRSSQFVVGYTFAKNSNSGWIDPVEHIVAELHAHADQTQPRGTLLHLRAPIRQRRNGHRQYADVPIFEGHGHPAAVGRHGGDAVSRAGTSVAAAGLRREIHAASCPPPPRSRSAERASPDEPARHRSARGRSN